MDPPTDRKSDKKAWAEPNSGKLKIKTNGSVVLCTPIYVSEFHFLFGLGFIITFDVPV